MGKWCAAFIQPPGNVLSHERFCFINIRMEFVLYIVPTANHKDDVDFQNLELNQMLALVSTLLSPIKERKEFLPEFLIDVSRSPNHVTIVFTTCYFIMYKYPFTFCIINKYHNF
jgi:hypothetical protein